MHNFLHKIYAFKNKILNYMNKIKFIQSNKKS